MADGRHRRCPDRPARRCLRRGAAPLVVVALAAGLLAPPASGAPGWTPAETVAAGGGGDVCTPRVALDARGGAVAVWCRQEGATSRVVGAIRPPGGPWQAPQPLSSAGRDAGSPQVAMDPSGTAIAVWELTLPAETRPQFAVRPAGGGWGPAADLPANRLEGARSPQIALDADGSALAAWIDDDAGLTRVVSAVRPAGGTWGAGERRSASAPDARDALPALAMLPGGRAVLAWWRGDAGGAHVQAALRDVGGTWTSARTMVDPGCNVTGPRAAIGPSGTAAVVWSEQHSRMQELGGPRMIGVGSTGGGGTWTARTITATDGAAGAPDVVVDALNGTTVAWTRFEAGVPRLEVATSPSPAGWGTSQDLSPGQAAGWARVLEAGPGSLVAVWQAAEGSSWRIEAATRDPGSGWGPPQRLSSVGLPPARTPDLAVDRGTGTALAVWALDDGTIQAAARDGTGPELRDLVVPDTPAAGSPARFGVTPVDAWSAVAGEATWSLGDGATVTGNTVDHAFALPGTYMVGVSAADVLGNTGTRTAMVVAGPPVPAGQAGGGGGGGGVTQGAVDRRAPAIGVGALRLARLRGRRVALVVRVRLDEPGLIDITARRGPVVLARARQRFARPGWRSVRLTPVRRLVAAGRPISVRLRLVAVDAAGNRRVRSIVRREAGRSPVGQTRRAPVGR